jgi:hypothetical protein
LPALNPRREPVRRFSLPPWALAAVLATSIGQSEARIIHSVDLSIVEKPTETMAELRVMRYPKNIFIIYDTPDPKILPATIFNVSNFRFRHPVRNKRG